MIKGGEKVRTELEVLGEGLAVVLRVDRSLYMSMTHSGTSATSIAFIFQNVADRKDFIDSIREKCYQIQVNDDEKDGHGAFWDRYLHPEEKDRINEEREQRWQDEQEYKTEVLATGHVEDGELVIDKQKEVEGYTANFSRMGEAGYYEEGEPWQAQDGDHST